MVGGKGRGGVGGRGGGGSNAWAKHVTLSSIFSLTRAPPNRNLQSTGTKQATVTPVPECRNWGRRVTVRTPIPRQGETVVLPDEVYFSSQNVLIPNSPSQVCVVAKAQRQMSESASCSV